MMKGLAAGGWWMGESQVVTLHCVMMRQPLSDGREAKWRRHASLTVRRMRMWMRMVPPNEDSAHSMWICHVVLAAGLIGDRLGRF